jgi:hypothetical protein
VGEKETQKKKAKRGKKSKNKIMGDMQQLG